jgi:hypothetical protein
MSDNAEMSTAIGKGTTSAPDSEVSVRQDAERRLAGHDAATRSAKFRTALGDMTDGAKGGGRLASPSKLPAPGIAAANPTRNPTARLTSRPARSA